MKIIKKLLIGILCLFMFVGIIGTCSNPEVSQETEEVIEEMEKEPVEVSTPDPTPVEEPVSVFTPEEIKYVSFMEDHTFRFSDVMYRLSNQCMIFSYDDQWITETALILTELDMLIQEVREINPPERFKSMHDLYMKAMNEYQIVVDELPVAIDNMDANHMEILTQTMSNGTEYIAQSRIELEQILLEAE
jgi:hypothetical protein